MPKNAQEGRAIIAALRMEIAAKSFPDVARDGSPAAVRALCEDQRAATSHLATMAYNQFKSNEERDAVTREEADQRVAYFRRQLGGTIRDEGALDAKCAWFESTLNIVAD